MSISRPLYFFCTYPLVVCVPSSLRYVHATTTNLLSTRVYATSYDSTPRLLCVVVHLPHTCAPASFPLFAYVNSLWKVPPSSHHCSFLFTVCIKHSSFTAISNSSSLMCPDMCILLRHRHLTTRPILTSCARNMTPCLPSDHRRYAKFNLSFFPICI